METIVGRNRRLQSSAVLKIGLSRIMNVGRVAVRMALALLLAPLLLASGSAAAHEQMLAVATGVSLRVIDLGPRDRRPAVVLIPGWGMSADVWSEQAARLSVDRRVVIIDPRSQGRSTIVSDGLTPEQRARDLEAVVSQLGLENVVLVGWSQGVQDIAAYVAAFGTRRLAGTILVDAAISEGAAAVARSPKQAAEQLGLISLYTRAPEAYARAMLKAIIRRPLDAAAMDKLVNNLLVTPTALGSAMLVADFYGVDRTPAIAKFDRPTLVIASAASFELQEQRAMAAKLPMGRLEVVDDAAHAVFIDQPDRFERLVEQFLEAIDQRS